MKRILCYGDSNTWGYISGSDHLRYGNTERWTKLLQNKLGDSFEIIEEGLNSRTLFSEDKRPGKEGKNGFVYLKPCIETHDKIDLIILMLGTNKLKFDFNNDAESVLDMMKRYVDFILNYKSQIDNSSLNLIISGIPLVSENSEYSKDKNKYVGAREKSIKLNDLIKKYCEEKNICYIDNTELETGIDGVHLTKESHMVLANKLYTTIKEMNRGMIMDNKKMTKEAHNAIADKYYELYKDDVSDLKYFDMFLKDIKGKILDLGCGMGHYSNYMYNKGFEVVGIDFSSNMINIAKNNNPNIDFIVSDVCDLKCIENKTFDGVVIAYVLQHLSKQEVEDLFKSLDNYINDNSSILIFTREGNGILEEIEPIDTRYKYVINEYSKEEIKELLIKNGWEISLMETKEYIEDPNSLAPTTLVVSAKKI